MKTVFICQDVNLTVTMVKCPDPACGFEGEGTFCSKCAKKLDQSELIGICTGKTSDGQVCGAPLSAKHTFCSNCGLKVPALDPGLDKSKEEETVCPKCGIKVKPDDRFCCKCGFQLVKAATKGK